MQRTVEKAFFALIRFEINGSEICDDVKNSITPDVLPPLFRLSKRHDLAHLVGDALDKNGLLPDGTEAKKRFLKERDLAVYRYEYQNYELEEICKTLEKAEIPFVPLKGSVIRKYYPEPWMRTSCDIDVLVAKENLALAEDALIRDLDYKAEEVESSHDVSLFSPSGIHLELHHALAEDEHPHASNDVLRGVWSAIADGDSYEKAMTDEMFYFYHIAHMQKHFGIGGCGIRPFLDAYILQKHPEYRSDACYKLLKDGKLLTFAKAVEEAARVWFGNIEKTDLANEIQDYILYAGMYADTENRAAVNQIKEGGRFKYLWSKIFLPYAQLSLQYPTIQTKKWLTPVYQVKRWLRLLFGKDARTASRELKANVSVEKNKKQKIKRLLEKLEDK